MAGWEVLQKLDQAVADTGRWAYLTGKDSKVEFMFINVDRAKVYLDALKSGKSVDDVMVMYKTWNIKPQDPAVKKTNSSGTRC